jgi:hypothetical protein
MTIHVLGLGESLSKFKPDGSPTIGVNDIHQKYKTDFVVCVDHPEAFDKNRLEIIRQTRCKGFYSQIESWRDLQNFNRIEFNRGRGTVDGLDSSRFCYSNSSPYVAAILAYKLGAKNIVLWGVDFKTHRHFVDRSKDRAIKDFKSLNFEFEKRGVNLFVGDPFSELSNFLPVFSDLENT